MIGLFFAVCAQAQVVEAKSWWGIDAEVGRQLINEEMDLLDWADALSESTPSNAREALLKMNVCVRVGLDDAACDALRAFAEYIEPRQSQHELEGMYNALWGYYEAYPVALCFVETFAYKVLLSSSFLKYYQEEVSEAERWSDAFLAQWLEDRVASVVAYGLANPPREDNPYWNADPFSPQLRPIFIWRTAQLKHLAKIGKAAALLDSLQADVLELPTDGGRLFAYLNAIRVMRNVDRAYQVDLKWIESCRPARATYQHRIARELMQMEEVDLAEVFYRYALDTSLTKEELWMLAGMRQAAISHKLVGVHFEISLREDLSSCVLALGRKDEAQQWMVEAADLHEAHGLFLNSRFSGRVQAESGARVIESRIIEAEEENLEDPEYWLRRAQYYRGRKEVAPQEEALRKALALTEPAPQLKGKVQINARHRVLTSLVFLLRQEKRADEGRALLLNEMQQAPIDSASSKGSARMFGYDVPNWIDPDEPILWDWLARRVQWEHTEERLLRELLERVPVDTRDPYFVRAEQLAVGDQMDPSRALNLGWILKYLESPERAIPVLQHALGLPVEGEDRQRCALTLLDVYLNLGDWQSAEALFALAEKRLTTREDLQKLGDIAVVAAEAGELDEAFRLWKRLANGSLKVKAINEELSPLGLGARITAYYEEVLERFPSANLSGVYPAE
ncbi:MULTISPECIES: hypothetical protein [unclassified Lentimonas]|uniref:hypothetical protein n=1 Tax=unclassified Lentimonas TaxID=2630993 RepID=UPI00138A1554|nr:MULTISPECIES: hypothetical protein [unclassified Lentimonas]